jgi:hypothetical protein
VFIFIFYKENNKMPQHTNTLLLLLLLALAHHRTSAQKWTQGYLAEYFHQCEPGSFVDEQMKDENFTPEVVCSDIATNGCDTPNLDFTNKNPTCQHWRGTTCGLEGGFPGVKLPDEFSARYTGLLTPPLSGEYEFCLDSDDGSKLWINGVMVADDNAIHGMGWPECGKITLSKNQPADLQVNYYENDGLVRDFFFLLLSSFVFLLSSSFFKKRKKNWLTFLLLLLRLSSVSKKKNKKHHHAITGWSPPVLASSW